ncbi:MAG: hypothetical protein ACYTF7_11910 [Planctomycetota bacterium]|jgi:hypothetical protein
MTARDYHYVVGHNMPGYLPSSTEAYPDYLSARDALIDILNETDEAYAEHYGADYCRPEGQSVEDALADVRAQEAEFSTEIVTEFDNEVWFLMRAPCEGDDCDCHFDD